MITDTHSRDRTLIGAKDVGTRNVVESAIESAKASHSRAWGAKTGERAIPWELVATERAEVNEGVPPADETAGQNEDVVAEAR